MKLRESSTDDKENGITVTVPDGISIYPNNVSYFWWGMLSRITIFPYNTAYCWWGWLSFILGFTMWIFTLIAESEYFYY